jgi:hypothetical protein
MSRYQYNQSAPSLQPTLPPRLAQRDAKLPKVALGSLFEVLLHHLAILLFVLGLDARQVQTVPVQSDEARDEQLVALLALVFGRGRGLVLARGAAGGGGLDEVHQRVVQQHGVAGGAVDDAV